MSKIRLDQLVLNNGLATSRQKAKILIMEGKVFVNNQKEDKPGNQFAEDAVVEVRGEKMPYVSRGGFKLAKAIEEFGIDLNGLVCMDIGASTGGFTDCMLQNGAIKVYAIDVGKGQLDYKLQNDDRVVSMEKTNIRYVSNDDLNDMADFASIDVSFISLKLVLPVVYNLINDDAFVVALIKPQFEAGREKVGKGGVVRDIKYHYETVEHVFDFIKENNFNILQFTFSPIKGPNGNIEYLVLLNKNNSLNPNVNEINYIKIIDDAFDMLNA